MMHGNINIKYIAPDN